MTYRSILNLCYGSSLGKEGRFIILIIVNIFPAMSVAMGAMFTTLEI